ncbi:MAG TPA: preprotein translocase subunit SecG [Longimicrobiaceae bacterium]|nr:preprotein translocase subunit SecG [Longimicrobiaceae bacterium]
MFLLVLLILDALVLIPVVLLQSGKGGGLAAMGGGAGTDTLFGSRQATTILHKASWWCGGIFIALAFALSLLSSRPSGRDSILREEFQKGGPAVPAGSAPAVPGVTTPAPATTPVAPAPAAGQGGNDPASAKAGQPQAEAPAPPPQR